MSTDILILSNGPGEISTWVKPVVQALRQQAPEPDEIRISVMLTPCPHATGSEHVTALNYPEVDRVQPAQGFYPFVLTGRTLDSWDWHPTGVVVFLGGDQLYPLLVSKRLGYRTVIYAEWEGRWQHWVDRFGAMQPEVIEKAKPDYRHKFTVVGDLMADVHPPEGNLETLKAQLNLSPETELLGLLPGSKKGKAQSGVPLSLTIANYLHPLRPNLRFVIPVAPTLTIETLTDYANPDHNPVVDLFQIPQYELVRPSNSAQLPYLKTESGAMLYLWTDFPATEMLTQCQLCLTTVGANTAQLGALAIPMIVLLPTQQLDAMRTWDGLPGILAQLPGIGTPISKLINRTMIRMIRKSNKRFAWPNIWAKREVVPELLGPLTAAEIGNRVLDYLDHPEKLTAIQQTLRELRGPSGAAAKMADIILDTVHYPKKKTPTSAHAAAISEQPKS